MADVRAPFVRVTLEDNDVKIDPEDVLSFSNKKSCGESFDQFTLTVMEKDDYSISKEIGEDYLKIKIEYGDSIQNSKCYHGQIWSYQSEIKGTNLYLTIAGYLTTAEVDFTENSINWSSYPELHNNPSEIVRAIAEENNWEIQEIVDTIPLRHLIDSAVTYDTQSTEEWDGIKIQGANFENTRTLMQENMSDIRFINEVLVPVSISRDAFLLDYAFNITKQGDRTIISYKPMSKYRVNQKNLCFNYNKSEGTFGQKEVISFNSGLTQVSAALNKANKATTVQDAFTGVLGEKSLDTTGMEQAYQLMLTCRKTFMKYVNVDSDDFKGDENEAAQKLQENLKNQERAMDRYEQASDIFLSIYYNKKIVEANADLQVSTESDNIKKYKGEMEKFGVLSTFKYPATLVTLGNQQLTPGDTIDILVMLNQGVHYTTGSYLILEQTDKIELGKYTTEYSLMKGTKAFLGSQEELEALGLSLADVFHSSYDSESLPDSSTTSETAPDNRSDFDKALDNMSYKSLGRYRLTHYGKYDGSSSDTTGSGKKISDFEIKEINGARVYTYKGAVVCAAWTKELKKQGYNEHSAQKKDTYLFRYWQYVKLNLGGDWYPGIILDSCGAAGWIDRDNIIDIFTETNRGPAEYGEVLVHDMTATTNNMKLVVI